MRPSPSIEPFTPSPDISLPHPVLRAALENLDVQLEEELVRYRRQRRLQSDRLQPDSLKPLVTQSRSFTFSGASLRSPLGGRPIAHRARTGIDLPSFKDFHPKDLDPDGNFPIGNSADAENPVKAILGDAGLGNAIAPQRPVSLFSRFSAQAANAAQAARESSVSIDRTEAYQSEAYQPAPSNDEESITASSPVPEDQFLSSAIDTAAIGIASYAQQPDLSAYTPSATLQKLAYEQFSNSSPEPEGYLESSEELLKSIEEEMPRSRRRADLLNLLLTPLGVGSMLLLLLSSAALGFLIMNPGTLSALLAPDADLAANPPSAPGSPNSPISPSSPSSPSRPLTRVPTTPIDSAPPSPDLSADEFQDVNLNTLSTLPSGSSASPGQQSVPRSDRVGDRSVAQSNPQPGSQPSSGSQSGAQAPTQTGSQNGSAAPAVVPQSDLPTVPVQSQPAQPQPAQAAPAYAPPVYTQPPYSPPAYTPPVYTQPSYNPSASPSSPSPTLSPAAPAQASPSASQPIDVPPPQSGSSDVATAASASSFETQRSGAQDYYYVGADYSGDSSLQQARQTIPDAYVRNLPSGGAIVQAGAFSSEAAAQERVQELQQQGFPAQIYRP
jgi:SPOR domain